MLSSRAMKPILFEPVESPHLVPWDGSFRIQDAPTEPPEGHPGKKKAKKRLDDLTDDLYDLQRLLYAHDRYAVLLVFQAMDAAGKDSTIRAVMTGVNPAGCQVFAFKQPSSEELDHDFLWRVCERLPERGRIGIFNRSHYEEVLIVRVHPEHVDGQKLPREVSPSELWKERYESIRGFERHLACNGTVVLKFFLNVSRDEQRERFLSRIRRPDKNWKFSSGDIRERRFWGDYMHAYEDALNETSRPWAPWYAIPADDKPYMRMTVAEIVTRTLERLDMRYPELPEGEREHMRRLEEALDEES